MKIIKFLAVSISLMLLVAGCGSAGKCPVFSSDNVVNTVFGDMRVKTDLPQNWVKIRETIGAVHVLIYTVLASEQPSAQNDAQAFFKAQGCDARMELDMYKDYILFGKEFTPESGNFILVSERVNDNYWRIKWQGKGPDHDYLIWDIIGVKDEVALHIRLTCPMIDEYEPFADRLQCDLDQIFNTLDIVPPTEETAPPADTVSENA